VLLPFATKFLGIFGAGDAHRAVLSARLRLVLVLSAALLWQGAAALLRG
jgi:hypothetical protein